MSAILGRIDFSGRPLDPGVFANAMSALAHYGGDGSGSNLDGAVGLGHHFRAVARRAATERQPVTRGPLTIVADTILDNRAEVAAALAIAPPEAREIADSELMLRAYERWGPGCLDRFRGDYAMAIWNAATRTLFLARDHIGTRPLYWRRDGTTVIFATDVRGLVAMTDLAWTIDESAIVQYLTYPLDPMRRGFFKGLAICPPGGHVTLAADATHEARWWDPANATPERFKKTQDYVDRLRELVERAVADRIDTDLKIGSHISGGIDSTSVSVIAQRQLKAQGRSLAMGYTWSPAVSDDFPDLGEKDERRFIRMIAEREGFDVRWGTADGQSVLDLINRPIELDGTADLLDELPVIETASDDGIGLMLSGWGGDEAFSAKGHERMAGKMRRYEYVSAVRLAQKVLARRHPRIVLPYLLKYAILPHLHDKLYQLINRSALGFDGLDFFDLKPGASQQTGVMTAEYMAAPLRSQRSVREGCRSLLLHGHLAARHDSWAAWSAGRFTYRYPLSERQMLEFSANFPDGVHLVDGKQRYPARRAVSDLLAYDAQKFDRANESKRHMIRTAGASMIRTALDDRNVPLSDRVKMDKLHSAVCSATNAISAHSAMAFMQSLVVLRAGRTALLS